VSSAPGVGVDVGAADPALVAALASADPARILPLLETARLLVAVVALAGDEHASEGEMALAMLESAGGERALPAFTSLAALTSWNAQARPVPRSAGEVIAYALAEALEAVIIDPGATHSWTLWREAFTPTEPEPEPEPEVEVGYVAPSWKPGRRARRAAAPHEVFAVDAPAGSPAIAVICPDGTLDTTWAQRLLAACPAGTGVIALPTDVREQAQRIGTPISR
jgi:SseB protein N-terminal domain